MKLMVLFSEDFNKLLPGAIDHIVKPLKVLAELLSKIVNTNNTNIKVINVKQQF